MISYPFLVQDLEMTKLLGRFPVAYRPLSLLHGSCSIDYSLSVWKFGRHVKDVKLRDISLPFVFHRSELPPLQPKLRMYLSFRVMSPSKRVLFVRKRLRYSVISNRVVVAINEPTVRVMVSKAIATFLRKTKKLRLPSVPRSQRPNPEVVIKSGRFFRQVGDTVIVNQSQSYTSFERTWTGSLTPGFRFLKGRNLPVNNHTVDVQSNVDGSYCQVIVDTIASGNSSIWISTHAARFGTDEGGTPPPISHLTSVRFSALQRLISRLGQGLDANIAQDMAQFGQLTGLIANTVTRLTKSITSLRRKDFPGAISALWNGRPSPQRYRSKGSPSFTNSLANNWLELQYGWKPLLMDIEGSMDSLAKFYQLGEHITRKVSASAGSDYRSRVNHAIWGNTFTGFEETISHTRYKFTLRYRIDSRLKSFLAQTGFTNPINLVWEVLPYSFVLDWFIPVGNYLQTISAFDGLEFVDGCETAFTRQLWNFTNNYHGSHPSFPSWYEVNVDGGYQRERVLLNRTRLTTFPVSNAPPFKNPLSTVHALNSLALLKAAFR